MEAVSGVQEDMLGELRTTFSSGRTRGVAWRKAQLQAILKLLAENEDEIFEALKQDLGKHTVEFYRDEVGVVKKSATNALRSVEKWMVPQKGRIPLIFFPARGAVVSEPLGVVLIFASWNFPISLALDPVIGAISAGNTVVLKPSDLAPKCSSCAKDVVEQLLQLKWDKIFFTGSPRVGRLVMSAAAMHLTPVALELGGKCPTIFDTLSNSSDLQVAFKRVAGGKWGPCNGQAGIGIDYVLVETQFAPVLYHFDRVHNLLKVPKVAASVVYGGSVDEENMVIEPTILLNPPLDADIMTEEIFGPLLPIITLNNIEESIQFINSRPKPLAIYAFTKNDPLREKILQETSSRSLTFNDAMVQFLCDTLPFGGVGQSGHGRYHGKFSFDTFSHEKAVLHRSFLIELESRYPPWNTFKLEFVRLAYDYDYVGLILLLLGLRGIFRTNRRQ
ncbi:unnamed protein product [Withania somnifera]